MTSRHLLVGIVLAATTTMAGLPCEAQQGTGSAAWQDLVLRIHARAQPIDHRPQVGGRPAVHASTLRVGTNVMLIEDDDNSLYEDGWFGAGGERSIESVLAAVYEVLEDEYDFVTVVLNWNIQGAFAYYMPIANETLGIGLRNTAPFLDTFDRSEGKLQGFIMMNNWRFYTRSDNQELSRVVWLQEIGHRWGSFVYFDQGDGARDDLLGRDLAHWSYFMHSENSALEGNDWHENPDGSFSTYTNARRMTYGQLDRYLMGLSGAETVPDFFFIDNPDVRGQRDGQGATLSRRSAPEFAGDIRTIFGDRVDVSIDDIIAAEGPRNPGVVDSQKVFRMATVYVVRQGTQVSDDEFQQVEDLVDKWEDLFEEATLDQMDLIVALDGEEPVEDVAFGEACDESAQCDNVTATTCITVDDDERICSKRCASDVECGPGYCCEETAGDRFCYPRQETCAPQEQPDVGSPDAFSGDDAESGEVDAGREATIAPPQGDSDCDCQLSGRVSATVAGRLLLWPFSMSR